MNQQTGVTPSAANALIRLEARLDSGARNLPRVRVSGAVSEIATTHYRVSGLSNFLRLGQCVTIEGGERAEIGEVVKIDARQVTLKPFESYCNAPIGARAWRADSLSLFPGADWKGRVIDALGRPIDGAGALGQGERAMPFDANPPAALQRARVETPIRTGVAVIDLFTPLCAGQRIGVFAGSGVGKSRSETRPCK